jgi:hypothetical protein
LFVLYLIIPAQNKNKHHNSPQTAYFCIKADKMKTLAVTVINKKQELLFTHLADELGIEITVANFKPLTTKDVALGIGRKFTDEELSEYIERKSGGKPKDAAKVKRDLKSRLAKKAVLK